MNYDNISSDLIGAIVQYSKLIKNIELIFFRMI